MDTQLSQYAPVLMLLVGAVVLTAAMLVGSVLAGKVGRRSKAKDMAWECGMIPSGQGTPRTPIKFHLVAMLFLLFDVAVVFLYPWAVAYRKLLAAAETGGAAFFGMLVFLGILAAGYVYAAKKGAFDLRE